MDDVKQRFRLAIALPIAEALRDRFAPACHKVEIAGSLRRRKPDVGDVELIYVPKLETRPSNTDMFVSDAVNLANDVIAQLEKELVLVRRTTKLGSEVFGPKIKLMRHRVTGIPVNLFQSTEHGWFSYLVCRTGPKESNERICMEAIKRGMKWKPYEGFEVHGRPEGILRCPTESDVFETVGLRYRPPAERV